MGECVFLCILYVYYSMCSFYPLSLYVFVIVLTYITIGRHDSSTNFYLPSYNNRAQSPNKKFGQDNLEVTLT